MGGNTVDHSADLSDVQFNHNENISESNSDVNGEHGKEENWLLTGYDLFDEKEKE